MNQSSQHKKYALFIGRYQTLHEGHKYLFRTKIESGVPVLVGIRNVEIDENNPFTPEDIIKMFYDDAETLSWIDNDQLKLMIIPDIEGVYYGRGVGYKVEHIEAPLEVQQISATKLREQNASSKKEAPSQNS